MIRLANVLIVDGNRTRTQSLSERLSHGGYHTATAASVTTGRALARAEHPDVIVLIEPEEDNAVAFGQELKADEITADIPVVLMADKIDADLSSRALQAGLDDLIALDCESGELFARLRPLIRLATMHAELHHRGTVAAQFGVSCRARVTAPPNGDAEILIIGDQADPIRSVLAGSCQITMAEQLFEGEDLLTRRNFDAAVVCFSDEANAVMSFCSQVRNNPRLFNLPLVFLHTGETDPSEIYRHGASRVLPQGGPSAILQTVVMTLVHRQQLRWAIRSALSGSQTPATTDPLTGAYSRVFLDQYLTERLRIAKVENRHLSILFFSAPSIDGVRRQFGDDAAFHLTQQLGQWITGLLRAEDLTAAFAPHEFCVVLPDTPLVEAEVVMHRIAGILAYTDFAVRDVYQPVKLWVQSGGTDARPQDDVATLLSRARRNLD